MKKIIIAAAFAACALGMNAQLTVLKPAYLNIGSNSNITVNALDKITSDGGIAIRNQGSLTLQTDRAVLKNDKVETEGSLSVRAHQITLEAGVSIDAGATGNFLTY